MKLLNKTTIKTIKFLGLTSIGLLVISNNLSANGNINDSNLTKFQDIKNGYFKSYDYEQMGKYDEAIKVLLPIYNLYPKGYTLNLRIGWLFSMNKKYSDALKYYKKASLINKYAVDPKLGIINIYLEIGKYKEAELVSQEILKVDYYNFYANLYIVRSLIKQKKYSIATNIINKMLYLYPTNVTFLEQLAIIYKNTKSKYLDKLYKDILILDPNNVFVRSNSKIK